MGGETSSDYFWWSHEPPGIVVFSLPATTHVFCILFHLQMSGMPFCGEATDKYSLDTMPLIFACHHLPRWTGSFSPAAGWRFAGHDSAWRGLRLQASIFPPQLPRLPLPATPHLSAAITSACLHLTPAHCAPAFSSHHLTASAPHCLLRWLGMARAYLLRCLPASLPLHLLRASLPLPLCLHLCLRCAAHAAACARMARAARSARAHSRTRLLPACRVAAPRSALCGLVYPDLSPLPITVIWVLRWRGGVPFCRLARHARTAACFRLRAPFTRLRRWRVGGCASTMVDLHPLLCLYANMRKRQAPDLRWGTFSYILIGDAFFVPFSHICLCPS